ncbi:hypothetical protein [Thermocoleostomius sinensis]|uniref:Uncharacterized protein n=1 Tax=Thermocoleostomius sinensis A174 TaxID=2016057 RepID=A0A9E9C8E1_9CYAN|nr:hypothetical protein [Thermocoleostomius sinensis]WAL58337.1 hypothetical protein OXH18_14195 [Thermocoleostomius sinensis A174]
MMMVSAVLGQPVQFSSIACETPLEATYEQAEIETLPNAAAPPLAP